MFNKSGVFGRNEPVNSTNRRDSAPMTSSGTASPPPAERLPGRPAPTVKEALPAAPVVDAAQPAVPVLSNETPVAGNDAMGARLIVGPDVKLKGAEILDCDTLVVEGRVEATMDSRVIRIADKGAFCGKVSIDVAEIHGTFEGELTARSQLIIHATGKVSGKIRYGKLLINEGGELCGDINTLSSEKSSPRPLRDEQLMPLSAVAG